jgi:hypothetical protein
VRKLAAHYRAPLESEAVYAPQIIGQQFLDALEVSP